MEIFRYFSVINFTERTITNVNLPGPAARRGIPRPNPRKSLLVPPETRNVPSSKQGLCPKESNRLRGTGVQFGVWDPKIPIINPVFVGKNRFCRFHDENHFLFFVFLVFTPKFVELCAHFARKTLFLVFTLDFEGKMSLCPPPKKFFMPAQSIYSGARPETYCK